MGYLKLTRYSILNKMFSIIIQYHNKAVCKKNYWFCSKEKKANLKNFELIIINDGSTDMVYLLF
jgi:glycosyltransferase involved in cell wall biosynthesis